MTTAAPPLPSLPRARVKPLAHWEDRLAQGLLLTSCAVLTVFLLAPLAMILVKSTEDRSGAFVGLQLFREYLQNAALRDSAFNTLWVALVVTAVTVPLAFTFAYALTRSCIPWKGGFRLIALTPILSPSMLAAISFIQWFCNQGAVMSLVLLLPVLLAFIVDWWMQGRHQSQFSARAVPFAPKPSRGFDLAMLSFCIVVSVFILAVLGMAIYTSFIKLWPYDLSFSLRHYIFGLIDGGVIDSYFNSLKMALLTAAIGTTLVFGTAYLLEKTRGMRTMRAFIRLLATIPMAVPGMVLGLGYIFFFNHPDNPLHFLYCGMLILAASTIVHYYTSSHLTAVTALQALDHEFEAVSASLKVPFYKTFFRVTVPVCLPAILDIARYLFVNAMVTISAVVFLYAPDTQLASLAILNLDHAGEIGPAAAMATLIVAASTTMCLIYALVTRILLTRTQAWRKAAATA